MCMADCCDDFVTLLAKGHHKARKQHKCFECHRAIEPGEMYHADRFLFEGSFTLHKTCAHCMVVRGWLVAECGGFVYSALEEDIREHVDEGFYGFGVKKLAIGMSRQWQRVDGRRWPLPTLPKTTHETMKASH